MGPRSTPGHRLLVVVATDSERAALLGDVTGSQQPVGPYPGWTTPAADVVVSGVGVAAAAAATATALSTGTYRAALSIGICGGFRGAAGIGDVVVATDLVAADLGADSPTGFLTLGMLGWDEETVPVDAALRDAVLDRLGGAVTGPLVSVSTVTGTNARADELAARHGAVAEAMEGWGVLTAARPHGVPVAEIRTVSNVVGDRNPAAWDLGAAFAALAKVGLSLLEEPWR